MLLVGDDYNVRVRLTCGKKTNKNAIKFVLIKCKVIPCCITLFIIQKESFNCDVEVNPFTIIRYLTNIHIGMLIFN